MRFRAIAPRASEMLQRAARWTATPAGLALLFLTGFIVRLLLGRGEGFPGDIQAFQNWAHRLADVGPGDFYSPGYFADYPPGYLYILWVLGELGGLVFGGTVPVFFVKLPGMVADVGLAYVVMRLASLVATAAGGPKDGSGGIPNAEPWWVRPVAASAILFNPPIIFLSAVWGQVDSVAALYALGGVLLLARPAASTRSEAAGAALLALAFATKPQTAFLLPVVALVLIVRHVRRNASELQPVALRLALPLLSFAAVWTALGIPFGLSPAGLVRFYAAAGSTYPVTSVWAFNFWGTAGFWQPDSGPEALRVLGTSALTLGVLLFAAAAAYVLVRVFRALATRRSEVEVMLAGGAAIVCLSFALLTRIHERYLFLGLACLAPLIVYRRIRVAFASLALFYMLNLFFPWIYYNEQAGRSTFNVRWLFDLVYGTATDSSQKKLLALVTGAACLTVAFGIWVLFNPRRRRGAAAASTWRIGLRPIGARGVALAGIVFLVVVPTRLAGLASPQEMYFDEIYHARTAGEYLQGKEAYEFTHPPLGKELMALSLLAFSGWGAQGGARAPAGLDSGIADSDGVTTVWAAPAPVDGGVLRSASLADGCPIRETNGGVAIGMEPEAIAVGPGGGAYVAGRADDGAVIARYSGDAKLWERQVDAPVVDLAAAGEAVYAIDDAGVLWRADASGLTSVGEGASSVVSDADIEGVWAAFPEDRVVSAYDAEGTVLASATTHEGADQLVVVPAADRVLALDLDAGLLEAIDNQTRIRLDELETTAAIISATPANGLAYAVDGGVVEVVEPRGLSVIGEERLPFDPVALLPVTTDGTLMAVGDNEVSCFGGNNHFAWRLPSALLGALVPALVFLLALRCTGNLLVAALSALFMAVDGLAYAMSRIATLDSQVTAHVVAAWLAALSVFFHAGAVAQGVRRSKMLGRVWLGATGLFLGLAIATKWVGLYSFGMIALLMIADVVVRRRRGIGILFPSSATAIAGVAAVVVGVPLGIYLLSYLPYLSLGHSFGDVLALQRQMYDYHAGLTTDHPYSSPWYGWPVGRKAVALWRGVSGTETGVISAIANPVVFIGGLWGMAVVAVAARQQRILALTVFPLAALTQYVPWVIVSRAAFLYHYLPVVPFLAIALAWGLAARHGHSRWARYETGVVAAGAVAVFALILPELDGWFTSPEFHGSLHGWFPWLF